MPPFRQGPVTVGRRLSGEVLKELREIGHGHRVNIVDDSYDVPRGAKTVRYSGNSMKALRDVVRLVPVEDNVVIIMDRDRKLQDEDPAGKGVSALAGKRFDTLADVTLHDEGIELELHFEYRDREAAQANSEPDVDESYNESFYALANEGDLARALFIKTTDARPFACASFIVGHSQRTD